VNLGGKSLKDTDTLATVGLSKGGKLYFRDLGPQVGWTTVNRYYYYHSSMSCNRLCLF